MVRWKERQDDVSVVVVLLVVLVVAAIVSVIAMEVIVTAAVFQVTRDAAVCRLLEILEVVAGKRSCLLESHVLVVQGGGNYSAGVIVSVRWCCQCCCCLKLQSPPSHSTARHSPPRIYPLSQCVGISRQRRTP